MSQQPQDSAADEHRDWSERMTAVVATRVRHYRQLRGMSSQKLADACTALGYPVHRSVLNNLENSIHGRPRSSVSLQLVLAIARVLDVPAVLLVLPIGDEDDVEILPGVHAGAWPAYQWFVGEVPLAQRWTNAEGTVRYGLDTRATDAATFEAAAETIRLYRAHSEAVETFRKFRPVDVSRAMDAVTSLVGVRRDLRKLGLHVPELEGQIAEAVAAQEGME